MDADTIPQAHSAGAVPSVLDANADQFPAQAVQTYQPREARSWRAVSYGPTLGPATDAQAGGQIMPHTNAGQPDPRGVWGGSAGHTGPTDPRMDPRPESRLNIRELELVDAQYPIDRPYAGGIGTDATRPAAMPKWLFTTPFDQWAQYGPSGTPKIEAPSPLASRPLQYDADLSNPLPSPGGSGATAKEGFDGPQTNTIRYLPAPGDLNLVIRQQDVSVGYEAHARSRGWALR